MADQTARRIPPAKGKLGVLCVGLGAVATTFIAGVENVRRGTAQPIGSLTQMGTIRLGKRTENRAPLIKDFVPARGPRRPRLRRLGPDPGRRLRRRAPAPACSTATSTSSRSPTSSRRIKPMPAVFDQNYVKRLDGTNVKTGQDEARSGRAAAAGHPRLQGRATAATAWSWSGARRPRSSSSPGPTHATLEAFEKAMDANDADHRAVDALRLRGASWKACRSPTARRT